MKRAYESGLQNACLNILMDNEHNIFRAILVHLSSHMLYPIYSVRQQMIFFLFDRDHRNLLPQGPKIRLNFNSKFFLAMKVFGQYFSSKKISVGCFSLPNGFYELNFGRKVTLSRKNFGPKIQLKLSHS